VSLLDCVQARVKGRGKVRAVPSERGLQAAVNISVAQVSIYAMYVCNLNQAAAASCGSSHHLRGYEPPVDGLSQVVFVMQALLCFVLKLCCRVLLFLSVPVFVFAARLSVTCRQ
jgi:hypothetical protein